MTEYVILIKVNEDWRYYSSTTARSGQSAIHRAISDSEIDYNHSQFVAIPARSWKPVSVQVETKTALRFS